jgi:hypothetical protein
MAAGESARIEVRGSIEERVDRELKRLWLSNMPRDYHSQMIFREDCLKSAIYHHLRRRLGDRLLISEGVRVWTEFGLGNGQRADIAVVRLVPETGFDVESVLAIIECKCKAAWVDIGYFQHDVDKIRDLSRLAAFRHTLFYLASIWEHPVEPFDLSMLKKRQKESWGKRVAELVGYRASWEAQIQFTVVSHNGLNGDLEL